MNTELNPLEDFEIDLNSLDEEFRKLPRFINAYSRLYAQAVYEYETSKSLWKEIRGDVFKSIVESSEKKPSDSVIESEVVTDEKVVQAHKEMREAERDMNTIKGHCVSMQAKKDMLIQLGANARKEV